MGFITAQFQESVIHRGSRNDSIWLRWQIIKHKKWIANSCLGFSWCKQFSSSWYFLMLPIFQRRQSRCSSCTVQVSPVQPASTERSPKGFSAFLCFPLSILYLHSPPPHPSFLVFYFSSARVKLEHGQVFSLQRLQWQQQLQCFGS